MRFVTAGCLALVIAGCGARSQPAQPLPVPAADAKSSDAQSLYLENYGSNRIEVYALGATTVKYEIVGPAGCAFVGPLAFTVTGWLVAECGHAIIEIPPGTTKAKRIITDGVPPDFVAMSVDASDNLYVAGENYTSTFTGIIEYSPWSSVPIRTIALGFNPYSLVTDAGGSIFLAHEPGAAAKQPGIAIYPPGTSVTQVREVPFPFPPTSMTRDAKGSVYVGGYTGTWPTLSAQIVAYAPGLTTKLRTIVGPPKLGLSDLRVDSAGRMYALYFGRPQYVLHHPGTPVYNIDVYEAGATRPSRVIHEGLQNPRMIAVDDRGYIYALNIGPHENHPARYVNPSIAVYAPGGSVPVSTITEGVTSATAIAVGP
ncbi:MAG TPA: hypothetical protein VGG89_10345 [Candidatus Baltobacteraceae bacterium]